MDELYKFLNENYVEDKDAMFRFDYQVDFLRWALQVPHYHTEWIIGVRGGPKDLLFGFITGIPVNLRT